MAICLVQRENTGELKAVNYQFIILEFETTQAPIQVKMSWSSFSSALNTGFINQVFLCMLFWCGVLFLTPLAAMMSEWWSWDVFECSVGSKAGTSFTIAIPKTKHTMFWTCFPSHELLCTSFKPCSTSPASPLLTKQERKITAESMWAQPEAAAAAEGALLSPSHAHPPAAELLNCGHLMAPLNSDNPWIQIIRNRKWMLNFFFF